MTRDYLGPLGRRVMEQLWGAGPQTVAQVLEALNIGADRPLAYTTVMTILVRLHQKGYVSRSATGRTYTYQAAMDEPTLAATVGRRELGRLIDRYGAASLARFAEDLAGADPALVDRLRRLADKNSR
jgi:predicted transcriptional regulator